MSEINIERELDEKRNRDNKRNRLVLIVGCRRYHITRAEAKKLRNKLNRFNLELL